MNFSVVSLAGLTLWALLLAALTGALSELAPTPSFVPDLLLVVLVSLGSRADRDGVRIAAIVFAAARAGLGSDPFVAVGAGYLAWIEFQTRLRRVFDVESVIARGVFAAIAAWLVGAWLVLVRDLRAPLPISIDPGPFALSWPGAFSAGCLAALIGGVVRFLPGLSSLEVRSWEAGGRFR